MKNHDIHPPLYFWLLHICLLVFGLHAWTGPLLNTLIASGAAVVLFFLARECFRDWRYALAASFLWFSAPSVVSESLMARQYDLMTFWGLLLSWQIICIAKPERNPRIRDYIGVGIVSALGLLTHFHFALFVAGCGLYVCLRIPYISWKRGIWNGCALAAGLILFLLIFGNPQDSFDQAKQQLQPFDAKLLRVRYDAAWNAFSFFWGGSLVAWLVARLVLLASIGMLGALWINSFRTNKFQFLDKQIDDFALYYFLIWTLGVTAGFYLAFLSPGHAMSSRYLCLTWPFLACVLVSLLRFLSQYSVEASWALGIILFGISLTTPLDLERTNAPESDPLPTFQKSEGVLIDQSDRGFLLPILYTLKDDQWIFVAHQSDILANPDRLIEKKFKTIAYCNIIYGKNSAAQGQKIVDYLLQYYLLKMNGTVWGFGNLIFGARSQKWD